MKIVGLVLACLVWIAALAGCGAPFDVRDKPPGADSGGAAATTTSAGGTGGELLTGGSGGAAACPRECVRNKITPFAGLSMYSIAAPAEVKPCPAPLLAGFEGYADLLSAAAPECPSCSCAAAACALPQAMHAGAAKCPGDGAPAIAFDAAPPGGEWDGSCTTYDAIAGGLECSGVPCVQSITIAPAVKPCEPQAQGGASPPPPSWGAMARECSIGDLPGEGCAPGFVCPPAVPDGFALCLYVLGDYPDCPGEYPRRLVVAEWKDERKCSPCACGDPQGAGCKAYVSVFEDQGCGSLLGTYTVTSSMDDGCHDLPPGTALGSKSAILSVDAPGACSPSGGEPAGAVVPAVPVTLCCQPDPGAPM